MEKMLFIIPPSFSFIDYEDSRSKVPAFTMPYGVLSISGYIEKYSKEATKIAILDLNVDIYKRCNNDKEATYYIKETIRKKLNNFKPTVVGISALFNVCYAYLGDISCIVKQVIPDCLLIMGGGLATNLYEQILTKFVNIDACCYSEGEIPVFKLLSADDKETYLSQSSAWMTRGKVKNGIKPIAEFVEDLDDIPLLPYDMLDLKLYSGRSYFTQRDRKRLELSLHTSRGCPFNCVFCANGSVHGKTIRYMSVERVIEDIKYMIDKYHIGVLMIEDDHFLSNKQRAVRILKELSTMHIEIEFPNGLAVYAIDEEVAKLLKKAGASIVSVACESGSDYVLKNVIDKPLRVNMIRKAVPLLHNAGITVHGFFVIGIPGEREDDRKITLKVIKEVGLDWVVISIAVPIVGSRLYRICKENDWMINDDFSTCFTSKGNIKTNDIIPEEMEKTAYLINLEANFINNYNLRIKNYEKVISYMKPIVERYENHAFAYYCLACAYKGVGDLAKAEEYKMHYKEIVENDEEWKGYNRYFLNKGIMPLC